MLKGHTDIYLMDAETGDVVEERHEDNLVTNAVQDVLSMNPFGWRTDIARFLPLASYLIGGVMLFPETIPESAADYFVKGQWPTGYASHNSDPNGDPRRGNFNPNESYATSNGYRLVWDFGTADANGDISAVCLANSYGGQGFELSKYAMQPIINVMANPNQTSSYFHFMNGSGVESTIDAFHDNAFYSVVWENDGSYKASSIRLLKWSANPHKQPLDRNYTFENPTVIYVDISEAHIGYMVRKSNNNHNTRWCFDESGLRILTDNYNNEGYNTYYVTTIAWDGTVSEIAIPKGDMEDLLTVNNSASYVYGNWLYLQFSKSVNSGHEHGFYAIDLTNTSNIRRLVSSVPADYSIRTLTYYDQCMQTNPSVPYNVTGLWKNSMSYFWFIALDDGEILYEDISSVSKGYSKSDLPFGHFGPYFIYESWSYNDFRGYLLHLDNTYLATINNLSTPITKTADRTLKIVYTLTEAS